MRFLSTFLPSLILCFFVQLTHAQENSNLVKGKIIEGISSKPLAYVNIGVVGKGYGTVSNRKGEFQFIVPESLNEEVIRVSMIGFQSREFNVAEFRDVIRENTFIALEEKISKIPEISITESKLKEKLFGNTSKSKNFTMGFANDTLGNEMAFKIKLKKKETYLKTLNLSIAQNDYDTLVFRINIYDVKRGKPGKVLNMENIIVRSTIESGVLSVDLTPYHLMMTNSFFIGVEYIEDLGDEELNFSAQFPGKTIYYRSTSHANWKKVVGGLGIGLNVIGLQ